MKLRMIKQWKEGGKNKSNKKYKKKGNKVILSRQIEFRLL
jgi:hypothetical protein